MCRACSDLNTQYRRRCSCGQRLDSWSIARACQRRQRVERFAKGIDRGLCGRERQALRLQVRVLDGEVQRFIVQFLVFLVLSLEFVEALDIRRVAESLHDRLQRGDVVFDLFACLHRLLRRVFRRLVGVRHDGAIRGVGGHRELHPKVCTEPTRLELVGQHQPRCAGRATDGPQSRRRERSEERGRHRSTGQGAQTTCTKITQEDHWPVRERLRGAGFRKTMMCWRGSPGMTRSNVNPSASTSVLASATLIR